MSVAFNLMIQLKIIFFFIIIPEIFFTLLINPISMLRIFKPEVYQGGDRPRKYFEGWYYKMVTGNEQNVFSFIPGISLNPQDPHSFIQFINGITGETRYIRYDKGDFRYSRKRLEVHIADSCFTDTKANINIEKEDFKIRGELLFHGLQKFPSSTMSPGIMGWYSFVPFMECKHSVVSMNHCIYGELSINDQVFSFNHGKGYIEKDWGTSFPSAWIWLQSNNFNNPTVSVMLSVAKIPWFGSYFMGFISFLHLNGETYLFTTYNNSTLTLKKYDDDFINIDIRNKQHLLQLEIERKRDGELVAPERGQMTRMIKESVDSVVRVSLFDQNNYLLFSKTGRRAGLEVTSNIFELLTEPVGG